MKEDRKIHKFNWDKIPIKVKEIQFILHYSGFPTYIVGGAVRDMLRGEEPKDFDLATKAKPGEIIHILDEHFPKSKKDYVGASFGVVIIDGIEIATFRGERYPEQTGKPSEVEVEYVDTIEEDLSRRDLTVNAIAVSSIGDIIDPYGGIEDLRRGLINFVRDGFTRILEDPARMLRAARFGAKLKSAFTMETAKACHEQRELIRTIAPERVRLELLKAMEVDQPSIFFGMLRWCGVLEQFLPELAEGYGHTGGRHHPEDVWTHNMLVGDRLSPKDPILRLAGFLHDIGKPEAFRRSGEAENFVNHHEIGGDILNDRLHEFKFSNDEVLRIVGLTRIHMFYISGISPKAQRKLLFRLEQYNLHWRDLIRLRMADHRGNLKNGRIPYSECKQLVQSITEVEETPLSTHDLPVKGGDLIALFDLKPGQIVGLLQKDMLQHALETGESDYRSLVLFAKKRLDFYNKPAF